MEYVDPLSIFDFIHASGKQDCATAATSLTLKIPKRLD